MAQKYSNYIVSEPILVSTPGVEIEFEKNPIPVTQLMSSHKQVFEEMFYADAVWLWPGALEGPPRIPEELPHVHGFDEVIAFIGSDPDNPRDLCGEIFYWLNGEKYTVTESCIIHIPAGASHGPIIYNRIDRPVFFAVLTPSQEYGRNAYSFEDARKLPVKGSIYTEEIYPRGDAVIKPVAEGDCRCAHVIHLDGGLVNDAFYADFIWVYRGSCRAPGGECSSPREKVVSLAICNQADPYDPGTGSMGITLEGEQYDINTSAMVCIPRNVPHGPWECRDIEYPVMVMVAGPAKD